MREKWQRIVGCRQSNSEYRPRCVRVDVHEYTHHENNRVNFKNK